MNRDDLYHITRTQIQKYITENYVFLDLPYYSNVGDVLIWEATLQLLKKVSHRCVYSCSVETYRKPKIKKNTILLFSGGGNFGDLWEKHQTFRHRVMDDFPENPIVQLPQSVWFEDKEKMLLDIQYYAMHKAPIVICLRDKQSFDIISSNYKNVTPVLMPDMVLALDINKVLKRNRIKTENGKGVLYFRRDDKEFVEQTIDISYDAEGDWPCRRNEIKWVRKHKELMDSLEKKKVPEKMRLRICHLYHRYIIKDAYMRNGIRFLMPYRTIYASRLHAAILGWLLGKEVFVIDNSYHKCSGVYDLWMNDWTNVKMTQ